jgi:hypothetical protein
VKIFSLTSANIFCFSPPIFPLAFLLVLPLAVPLTAESEGKVKAEVELEVRRGSRIENKFIFRKSGSLRVTRRN